MQEDMVGKGEVLYMFDIKGLDCVKQYLDFEAM